ncbi:MAG: PIN domain-containing protein [Thermodesulfovibrionales bacterium]|nr:PIN domain-containing protein [Thermodesulfovibrionales bacterium]
MVKTLIDTSVWIEFFRKQEPYYSEVLRLLNEDKVCIAGIIVAELIQGAKGEKELAVIKSFISVFEYLQDTPKIWQKSGELSFMLRQKGITVGLSDCHLAVLALENNVNIFSLDKHFEVIKDTFNIDLYKL